MKDEIKVFECDTVEEAEQLFFEKIEEGCWQMHKALDIFWSWRKWKYVVRFSMRKVEKAYHITDHMKDMYEAINKALEMSISIIPKITEIYKLKRECEAKQKSND